MRERLERINFIERFVRRDRYRIYSREYPGKEPATILMHGFPDNLHLYDRLVPYVSPAAWRMMPPDRRPLLGRASASRSRSRSGPAEHLLLQNAGLDTLYRWTSPKKSHA